MASTPAASTSAPAASATPSANPNMVAERGGYVSPAVSRHVAEQIAAATRSIVQHSEDQLTNFKVMLEQC